MAATSSSPVAQPIRFVPKGVEPSITITIGDSGPHNAEQRKQLESLLFGVLAEINLSGDFRVTPTNSNVPGGDRKGLSLKGVRGNRVLVVFQPKNNDSRAIYNLAVPPEIVEQVSEKLREVIGAGGYQGPKYDDIKPSKKALGRMNPKPPAPKPDFEIKVTPCRKEIPYTEVPVLELRREVVRVLAERLQVEHFGEYQVIAGDVVRHIMQPGISWTALEEGQQAIGFYYKPKESAFPSRRYALKPPDHLRAAELHEYLVENKVVNFPKPSGSGKSPANAMRAPKRALEYADNAAVVSRFLEELAKEMSYRPGKLIHGSVCTTVFNKVLPDGDFTGQAVKGFTSRLADMRVLTVRQERRGRGSDATFPVYGFGLAAGDYLPEQYKSLAPRAASTVPAAPPKGEAAPVPSFGATTANMLSAGADAVLQQMADFSGFIENMQKLQQLPLRVVEIKGRREVIRQEFIPHQKALEALGAEDAVLATELETIDQQLREFQLLMSNPQFAALTAMMSAFKVK